jgi:hypothetical protein
VCFLFYFCLFSGNILQKDGNILWEKSLWIVPLSLVLGIVTSEIICAFGFMWFEKLVSHKRKEKSFSYKYKAIRELISHYIPDKAWVRFSLCLLLIFLAWLPVYLAYYPAICSYDFTIQLGQIVSGAYNDHHPLLHTLLIKGFMELGTTIFRDTGRGLALFALIQMLSLAAVLSGGIRMLATAGVKWYWRLILLLYSMFFPVNWYMSITLAKDTVFTIFTGCFFLCYYALLQHHREGLKPGGWDIGYLAAVLGMVLFRNNGRYALLVLLVVQFLTFIGGRKSRKFYGRMFCVTLLGILLGNGGLRLLFQETGAIQGDAREMISVPIQQVSRVMVYHEDEVSEQDRALVDDFILYEAYRNYRPEISDPVKGNTVSWVVRYLTKDFLDTYLRLFREFPGDYLNAVLALDAGYLWMGDVSHAAINQKFTPDRGMGYIQTRWLSETLQEAGINRDSKWSWLLQRLETFADTNAYLTNPLLRYLVAPGIYLWGYLLVAGIWLIRRRFRLLLPMAFVLGYYITLLLGPAVQLRYLYPLMICLPFLLATLINGISDTCPKPIHTAG